MKKLSSILLVLLSLIDLRATHIVGGEMTYKFLGNNQYRIRLDVYIDCINGSAEAIQSDETAIIGIFNGDTRNILSGYPIYVARKGPTRIQKTNYNCLKVTPNACVDHYVYETTVTLPATKGGYYMSFQRCCRNGSITNIVAPGATGANYWAFIPNVSDVGFANTSAVFKELPPNFLCTNTALKFDHSATDADGDSLVYSLITPYLGADQNNPRPNNGNSGLLEKPPFTQLQWRNSYTFDDPIDGNPSMNINPETGLLTLTPTRVGQFVVGISVKEYRKGKLVAEVIRDYQFNVQSCVVDVVASFFAPKYVCGYSYQFQNLSSGAQRYHWDFGVSGTNADTSNIARPTFSFPGPGTYEVTLIAYKTTCADSFKAKVIVVEPQKPKLPRDTTLCDKVTMTLKSNIPGEEYRWSSGARTDSLVVSNAGTYILAVTNKTCTWYDTIIIAYDREKVDAKGDTIYCSYDDFIRVLTTNMSSTTTFLWDNGQTTPNITINKPQKYKVTATTINKCVSQDSVQIIQQAEVKVHVNDTQVCPNYNVTFEAISSDTMATFSWSNGTSGKNMITNALGKHYVIAQVAFCYDRDTFTLTNFPRELELGNDLRFCNKIDTLITSPSNKFKTVVWNNEVTNTNFRLTKPGRLHITVVNSNGCIEKDSINIQLFPNPALNLGPDTTLCLSEKPRLNAGPGMVSYLWNTGSNKQEIIAYDSGKYWVEVIDIEGCKSVDSVLIIKRKDLFPIDIYMPSAFTPNGDELNDVYPNSQYQVEGAEYNVKLFNRWGEKLAEFNNPTLNWDGNINGQEAPEGVYVYTITWVGCDNVRRTLFGDFLLMR